METIEREQHVLVLPGDDSFENRDPLKGDGNAKGPVLPDGSKLYSPLKTETRLKGMETLRPAP